MEDVKVKIFKCNDCDDGSGQEYPCELKFYYREDDGSTILTPPNLCPHSAGSREVEWEDITPPEVKAARIRKKKAIPGWWDK